MDNVTHQRMVAIFNEWAERYVKNPADFDNVVDENGNVIKNYGERCAAYFERLAKEMDDNFKLPQRT